MALESRLISNVVAVLLITFASMCFQGHLTTQLTPTFAEQIAASIRPLNEKVFGFLALGDEQLNYLFAVINLANIISLVPRTLRRTGFVVNMVFYSIGFCGNIAIGESLVPHLILIWLCVMGYLLRPACA